MKIVFFGGPWDGEARDIPLELINRGVVVLDDRNSKAHSWLSPHYEEPKQFLYVRCDAFDRYAMRPLNADLSWPVMVPSSAAGDPEALNALMARHSRPVVKGPRDPQSSAGGRLFYGAY